MRRGNFFWGGVILIIGVVLLLNSMGIIPQTVNIWGIIWPALLIMAGLWVLFGGIIFRGRMKEVEEHDVPLDGTREALVKIKHGAGELNIHGGAAPDKIMQGSFTGGLEKAVISEEGKTKIKLKAPSDVFVFPGNHLGFNWNISLNQQIPLSINIDSGASSSNLDLSSLMIRELKIEGGASSTTITMPEKAGLTEAKIETGASSVSIKIPQGVSARIYVKKELASISLDTARFPMVDQSLYVSPDYGTAANRLDLQIKTDLGSIEII